MPKKVELALTKAAKKKGIKGQKAVNHFVYGVMTNMAKRGEIKWKRGKM
jgi:hypothetical protein